MKMAVEVRTYYVSKQHFIVRATHNQYLSHFTVYALEWDPQNHYMKSWFFHRDEMPENLQQSIKTASLKKVEERTMPDTHSWGLPYAYFAIGDTTGCSADHL